MPGPDARVVVAVAVALALAAPATAQPRATASGFDHVAHAGRVSVGGLPELPCAACHTLGPGGGLIGRPGHAACFGACHGPAPRPGAAPPAAQRVVCEACHAPAELTSRRPRVAYPPYRLDPDYPITISHLAHASASCATCHRIPGAAPPTPRPAPHARCAGCHDGRGAAVAMTACTTCHAAAYGANATARLERGPLAVGAAYDHVRHAGRGPAAACATCHDAVAATAGLELPTPTVDRCSAPGCHDGQAAFAVTERCTTCHTTAPTEARAVVRPPDRFSHQRHAARLPLAACEGCHRLDAGGEPRVAGHAACAACHAADFTRATPTICGACHASTEPWRRLYPDRAPPPTSELGARMDHARHAAVACARCHTLTTAGRELRPPRGHAACAGAGCHQVSGGPAPALATCAACHEVGLERARIALRTAAAWSTRRRFRHDAHATDAAGAPLACVTCHPSVATSTDAATVEAPAKASCAPCHDGRRAFKMTGHGCARCHGD